jgi:hypothetical protein
MVVNNSYIMKTGLNAFDTARAWGWAVVLNVLTEDEVSIHDEEWRFRVQPCSSPVHPDHAIWNTLAGRTLFFEQNWQRVFITQKGKWKENVEKAQRVLQQHGNLLQSMQNPDGIPFGKGESLPGGLDPGGFKGLRQTTRAQYGEGQLEVSEDHWALACLGMAACGTYYYAAEAGQSNWLVLLPVPHQVRMSYFRDVYDLFRLSGLRYHGIQNAAAHYAVQLAERLRRRSAAQGGLQDCYSAILYFRLFGAGQQTKPAQGNQLRLEPLMNAIQHDPHRSQRMLNWLDYCFRLGATKGAENLALATTELVMRWDLEAYDRLVRIAVRHQAQGRMKRLPEKDTLEEIIRHVHIQ